MKKADKRKYVRRYTDRFNMVLEPEISERLRREAGRRGISASGLIRMLILQFFDSLLSTTGGGGKSKNK